MEHKHRTFQLELSELRTRVSRMGELVIEQLEQALVCLTEHNIGDARTIIERDINLNRIDIDVEEMCLQFLALHQPVAGDLRFITAAMKITTELERIGDRVVNLCEAVVYGGEHPSVPTDEQVPQIGKLAAAMVRDAMAAFSRGDAALVRPVMEKDKEFDALYSHVFPNLITSLAKDPERIAQDAKLALLSKDLNEISEHATNIAEMVMFMVEGKELQHMDMYERRTRTD
ncbi:MAG: phosphate signaling complex protein PhoU [Deltaproteobacteria bacterium]|nr:phosphate signaling complex protein PhoU [Deltaproteobacteria bacterium]